MIGEACLREVEELLVDAVDTPGEHHKQWFLEEIAQRLGIDLPEHEEGVAP